MAEPSEDLKSMNDILDQIEEELRAIGRWQEQRVDPLATLPPSGVAALSESSSFTDWLEFEFLPAARSALADRSVPKGSLSGLIALREHADPSGDPEVQKLVQLLEKFTQAL
jgi:uncharacterized protein YqcC (DUF446 family)